jgi:serine protease Do
MMYHKSLKMNRPTRHPRRFFSCTLIVINTILTFILIDRISIIGSLNAATPTELNRFFVKAARKAQPSVVNIIIYQVRTKNGEKYYSKVGYGSGTIITKSGYVITNYHVVKKGNFYQITLHDGTECEVQKIKNGKYYIGDVKTDIALLKIDESDILDLKPIEIDNSNHLSEGEWVIAIGNPYGLRQSVTCGIVSSKGRNDIGFADIEDFIQTDVPINPGNSGGPLINLQGKLVGINTAIRTITGGYQGISFAIPSNIVRQVSNELIRYGRVRRGWLGFIAREKKIYITGVKTVVEVISVIKDSPAESSGIRKGDVIKEINGMKIHSLGELVKSIGNKPVNSKLAITISRDGHLFEYSLILREKTKHRNLQRGLRSLYSLYGIELDETSRRGDVIISYLSPMGVAYQNGLKKGDVIISVNGTNTATIEDIINVFYKSKSVIQRVEIYRGVRQYKFEFTDERD